MRSTGQFVQVVEQLGEVGLRPAISPRQAFTFCPRRHLFTPCSARPAISATTSSNGRDTSSPRVYGTTQKLQYLLHLP